jgi:hypothetical protein
MKYSSFVTAGALVLAVGTCASAQPTNVRAWYAEGQVFVVWERPAPPALPTDTVEVFASAAAQATTAGMTRVGRLFFPEYTGARLQALVPGARLLVPTPGGGTYRLTGNEGAFAYTPRSAGNLFFAVVDSGSNAVVAGNSAATAFNFDPVGEPVVPHPQFSGFTTGGNPYVAYVVWADGRDDDNARPDVPVLADADKNGVPHVFTITEPPGGVPAGPLPCVLALHGGGGEYQLFRPGMPQRSNISLGLSGGIVVTPDDSIYSREENALERTNTSWFGYAREYDPFFALPRNVGLPGTATVFNFTSRRVFWIMDWVQGPLSPYTIDADRVAMIGHSGGGRGTSHLTRQQPHRFAAAVVHTPASDLSIEAGGRIDYLKGNWSQNLATSVIGPAGTPVGVTDLFTMTTRISPIERDFPLTRVYFGKRDQDGPATWSPTQRGIADALNAAGNGYLVSWDERDHGVEKWSTEENDLTDGQPGPWPDIGQWIAPVKTRRPAAQYLVETYRRSQSYPAFFNTDADPLAPGLQPDPGPGDPDLGDPYGTWGGYLEWDAATLVDDAGRWGATLFATGFSPASIDNSPYASFTTDLTLRRTAGFRPPVGRLLRWTVQDAGTLAQIQSGSSLVGPDGVVTVSGVVVPRDPARVRLTVEICRADFDLNGSLAPSDIFSFLSAYFAGDPAADFNNDGVRTPQDIFSFLNAYFRGC